MALGLVEVFPIAVSELSSVEIVHRNKKMPAHFIRNRFPFSWIEKDGVFMTKIGRIGFCLIATAVVTDAAAFFAADYLAADDW